MAARATPNINKAATASSPRHTTRSSTHSSHINDRNSPLDMSEFQKNFEQKFEDFTAKILDSINAQREAIINHIDTRIDLLEYRTHTLEDKVTDRDNTIAALENQVMDLQTTNTTLAQDLKSLSSRLNHLEQHGRRWQVRISGLPIGRDRYESTDTAKNLVCDFLSSSLHLNLSKSSIDCAHRIGKPVNNTHSMLVRFHDRDSVDLLIANRSKLKGTPHTISEDSTALNRGLCNRLYKHDQITNSWIQRGSVWAKTTQGLKFKMDIADDLEETIAKHST